MNQKVLLAGFIVLAPGLIVAGVGLTGLQQTAPRIFPIAFCRGGRTSM